MTPYEKAQFVYHTEPCARTFAQDLWLHTTYGNVIICPEYFVMLRRVTTKWPPHIIVDPSSATSIDGDCWHIYLAAGDLRKMAEDLIKIFPNTPYVSYERKNILKIRELRALRNRLKIGW